MEGEIVLVLDYSTSMRGNKYRTMRDAAKKLVNTVGQEGKNDKVKFGLVPYAGEVYVTLPKRYVMDQSGSGDWTNCTADRKWPYSTEETTPEEDNDDTKWGYKDRNSRCSTYQWRNLKVQPLTNNHSEVIDQLQSMSPSGMTHIALGMAFGWHVISLNASFTEGVPYDEEDVLKAIILLTEVSRLRTPGVQMALTIGQRGRRTWKHVRGHQERGRDGDHGRLRSQG